MERKRHPIRDPEDRALLTFIQLSFAAVIRNPEINDEDFRLLAFKLGHDAVDIMQIGWNLKEQVDVAEKRELWTAPHLKDLWGRGLRAGLFAEMPSDGLDTYRKAFE